MRSDGVFLALLWLSAACLVAAAALAWGPVVGLTVAGFAIAVMALMHLGS